MDDRTKQQRIEMTARNSQRLKRTVDSTKYHKYSTVYGTGSPRFRNKSYSRLELNSIAKLLQAKHEFASADSTPLPRGEMAPFSTYGSARDMWLSSVQFSTSAQLALNRSGRLCKNVTCSSSAVLISSRKRSALSLIIT